MNRTKKFSATGPLGRAALSCAVVALLALALPLAARALEVESEHTVNGLKWPESCAYDAEAKVLYCGEFVSKLDPALKDGKGVISTVSLDGVVLEHAVLPAAGQTMNKPKGIWIVGSHLWVTDIDGVWEFDTKTKQGKKLDLPGAEFANDVTILGNTLYVSDNRADKMFSVEPADFLGMSGEPKVAQVWAGKGINPNGVYPGKDGSLLMVGFKSDKEPRGIYSMTPGQDPKPLTDPIGRLDGLYQMENGDLIVTDWNTGSVFTWNAKAGMTTLTKYFTGPADLCAFPYEGGLMVVVPDLAKSEVRMVQLK